MQMNRRRLLAVLMASLSPSQWDKAESGRSMEHDAGNESCLLRYFILPTYTPFARQAGIESRVSAQVHVGTDGKVISVGDYSGHEAFKETVSDALKQWQFSLSNDPQRRYRVEFRFSLKGTRDERCLDYKVSGTLPDRFEIEANPFPDIHS